MLCLYLVGQGLSSKTYSRKYEKLPKIVTCACKHIREKMNLLKMCGLQIRLCLFTFRPIASKHLNSLTTIVTFSWLGGAVVMHPLWLREVPGSNPDLARVFMFDFLFCCCCCIFTYLSKNTLFVTKMCNFLFNINLFIILNIL